MIEWKQHDDEDAPLRPEVDAWIEACEAALSCHIAALEAEIARLTEDLRLSRLAVEAWTDNSNAWQAEAKALRQPCTCNPVGIGDACNGCCHVRNALGAYINRAIPWTLGTELLMAFDAAVQAVREGQG
jgi:hypothetical protein